MGAKIRAVSARCCRFAAVTPGASLPAIPPEHGNAVAPAFGDTHKSWISVTAKSRKEHMLYKIGDSVYVRRTRSCYDSYTGHYKSISRWEPDVVRGVREVLGVTLYEVARDFHTLRPERDLRPMIAKTIDFEGADRLL